MRTLILVVALCSCAHVSAIETDLVNCGKAEVQDVVNGIVGLVGVALDGGDYVSQLEALVAKVGEAAVVCAVEQYAVPQRTAAPVVGGAQAHAIVYGNNVRQHNALIWLGTK